MHRYFRFQGISSQNSGVEFISAGKVYANSTLRVKRRFREDLKRLEGEIENVDFSKGEEAAGKINKWVREKTAGKIEKIVDTADLNDQTSLLVLNTIYFKGLWKNQFDFADTRKEPFLIEGNERVMVDMMTQENEFQYGFLNDADASVINLPYKVNK